MIGILLFPFRLLLALLGLVVWLLVVLPLRVVRLPMRILGFRGTLGFAAGAAAGLLAAPGDGSETRRRLRERIDGARSSRGGSVGLGR